MDDRIFQLPTREIPKKWLNIQPSLPEPVPPMLNPATASPCPSEAMQPLFPNGLLEQEVSQKREIPIPDEVLKVSRCCARRPSSGRSSSRRRWARRP